MVIAAKKVEPIDEVEVARKELVATETKIKETEAELERLKDKVKELNAKIPPPRQATLKECLDQQYASRLAETNKRKAQEEALKRVLKAGV